MVYFGECSCKLEKNVHPFIVGHLLLHRNEAQELVHVAHRQPVRVESHRGLHLLGTQDVLQGLVHLLALLAANIGVL